tara:strand:- start:1571 stop:2662 length:1092 start_codon:yes stop_codon:yes gene_type:complete
MEVYIRNMELSVFKKENDIIQQRALFKECFPETKGTSIEKKNHYLWKFHSFPSHPLSYEYAAFFGTDLVGYYAALPYPYIIKGNLAKAGMVCDVMTGVAARGMGVFTKMGIYATEKMKNEDIEFTTGFPIRQEVIPGHIKAGWHKMFSLPLYMNFLSTKSLLRSKKIKSLVPILDLLLNLYNYLFSLFQKDKSYDVSLISSLELESILDFDSFIESWVKEHEIALNKNTLFLKWRLTAPGKKYKIVLARRNNKILGYAVFCSIVKENVPSIAILDISCLKNHKKLSSTMIAHIQEYARECKAEVLMMMASKHVSKLHGLSKIGFLRSPYKFLLIIKNLKNNYASSFLKNEKNWHLTWIDTDDL